MVWCVPVKGESGCCTLHCHVALSASTRYSHHSIAGVDVRDRLQLILRIAPQVQARRVVDQARPHRSHCRVARHAWCAHYSEHR